MATVGTHVKYSVAPGSVTAGASGSMAVFIAFLIVVYQFLPIAHFVLPPVQIAGKNAYTLVPAALTLLLFLLHWPGVKRNVLTPQVFALLAALVALWLLVFAARSAFYAETGNILFQRFVIMLFVYAALFLQLSRAPADREMMGNCLVVVAIVQTIIGMIHSHFFPQIELVVHEDNEITLTFDGNGSREFGTLVSASVYAGVLVCGQFVLLGQKRPGFGLKLLLMALITYGVTLSGSRYPIVVSALLTVWLIVNRRMERRAPLVICVAAIALVGVIASGWTPFEFKGIMRFNQDDGGRFEKTALAIEVLASHWSHLLIGAPDRLVAAASTYEGITISDNSYALIALQFGMPLLLVWLACTLVLIVRRPPGLLVPFMLAYFYINLAATNSVLWDPWLFYFCIALWVVRSRDGAEVAQRRWLDG